MKRKVDFVTNSSTSSFIAWGISIDESDVKKGEELLKKLYEYDKEYYKKYENEVPDFEKWKEDYDIIESLYGLARKQKLDCARPCYDDTFCVGRSPFEMEENETLAEFKDKIKADIKEAFGIEVEKLTAIEEVWEDR